MQHSLFSLGLTVQKFKLNTTCASNCFSVVLFSLSKYLRFTNIFYLSPLIFRLIIISTVVYVYSQGKWRYHCWILKWCSLLTQVSRKLRSLFQFLHILYTLFSRVLLYPAFFRLFVMNFYVFIIIS